MTGEIDGDINYLNKDGEKVHTKGFSGSIPLEEFGIPASISGSVSSSQVKDAATAKVKEQHGSMELSIGAVLGAAVFKEGKQNKETNEETVSYGTKVGAGAKVGGIVVGDLEINAIETKITKIKD